MILKTVKDIYIKYDFFCVILLSAIVSLLSFTYFYYTNYSHLAYSDALSRLNISRRVLDSLTPGLAQLGNLWLPLPQILMLPFIWSKPLWQSGIAGYIISGLCFVTMNAYIYIIGIKIFKNRLTALVAVLICLSHTNILYMQTTSMSEIPLIFFITAAYYHLSKWGEDDSLKDAIWSAIYISASTLTRYEGYATFLLGVFAFATLSIFKYKKFAKTEGLTVLFTTLAATGIFIWLGYSWVIFGDPFYWKDVYGGTKSIISTDTADMINTLDTRPDRDHSIKSLFESIFRYLQSSIHMIGIIYTFLAAVSTIYILFIYIRHRAKYVKYIPLLLLMGPFLFVVYSNYWTGLPIEQPPFSVANLSTKNTSNLHEYNIRYGLEMFPMTLILICYLLSIKKKYILYITVTIIFIQILLQYQTNLYTMFQLNLRMTQLPTVLNSDVPGKWFKENYDDGLILISTLKNDPLMFTMAIDYDNYIYEGTGKYWLIARDKPQKVATWIYMHKNYSGARDADTVTRYLHKKNLKEYYDTKYDNNDIVIYKLKDPSTLDESVRGLGKAK